LIHGIITEKGIIRKPFEKHLKKIQDERSKKAVGSNQ